MFAMLVEINIKEDKEEEFLEVFERNQVGTRQEEGNLRFDVLRDTEIRTRFYAYEVYKDQNALEEHRKTPHYHRCVQELESIMTGSRSKKIFEWVMPENLSNE
ncbi:(4S)-4-hydroxy-5-phosphonooxypentane-2,3-dione isomerase [Phocoenobacter skyensis]|uniref:(4S)-4-hydroxy-5-phosphonooxypentane-2,3-dione isomerase n=1 Tax=Phocoenobacter skyensis TaxID=97481 RepID=A0A1H7UX85_9PAST|nr:(4S)-4-hydroxy-5-phosphonooxypentane-2,3-dione isomerase [Pasteurella skyensis]MDP8078543.1 (4S)-4-hydroxy-5-phosphonooxypentane-2,3-dione isomerase [Pasteurella skyensis]MDP8084365.1 (4S)-4-hydroxy-5-phosphonooxypentane-2,3-dione isomerase [Pasteurella skyensis]MDP8171321.1 (4S)-4-hydroxy-5-phosphonooxypentane-2,3-dione isomerase [Pasteurella skyensis]MDP8175540.1 (4S)-4-hydroxy-5-phosphonooxypentane-2,3-dione isomerase [Pasteurella skyensis]MDP8184696.1 (4S)-4-hydroxy-5-phosphonooxypentan